MWWQPPCYHEGNVKRITEVCILTWLSCWTKTISNYLWSCCKRKINLYWIITIRVWFSVSCTKHISNWYRGGWRKLLPKWLDFTHIWELKTNSEDNLTRWLEPTGSAPAPVENNKELPNLITEGTKQPSSEASELIVYLNLIRRQSKAAKWSQWWMLPHQLFACSGLSPLIINSFKILVEKWMIKQESWERVSHF